MNSVDDAIRAALDTPANRAQVAAEEQRVRDLGEAIGYGRVMQLAEHRPGDDPAKVDDARAMLAAMTGGGR